MYRDPFTAVVMEMPVTARTSEDGSRTLSESSHTPTRNKNISYKSRPKFVHCYSPIWLFQLSCLSCWGRKTSCSQTLFIHLCLPQHLLGWIGSLLVHNQGAQTPCFSPSWCVMKSQGPPSGWARKTDPGWTFASSYKGWRHWCGFTIPEQQTNEQYSSCIYNDINLGLSAESSSLASWSLLSQSLDTC